MLERLRQRRTTIILALVASILLITLDTRGNKTIDRAREIGTEMFTPVRAIGRTLAGPFENAWHGAFEYQKLRKENIRLRDQASKGEADAIAGQAAQEMLDQLRAALNLPNIGNPKTVLAEVVGGSASNFEQGTLEINKGASSGIKEGMAVITSAGMIGSVRQVTDTRAKVRLLFDPNLGVSVKIVGLRVPPTTTTVATIGTTVAAGRTATTVRATTTTTEAPPAPVTNPDGSPADAGPPTETSSTTTTIALRPASIDKGSTEGHGRGQLLEIKFVDEKYDVQVGDDVVTSGEGDDRLPSLFPPNLPVGKVVEVNRVPGSTQLQVKVKPLADFENLNFVSVVLYDAGG